MTWWQSSSDQAASEVVGYVLVTGISVLAITVVMLTGGPALEEIRSSQQHDSMLGYFHDLDAGFSMLLSGSPAGSTPVWRVSMSSGSISLDQGQGHVFVYAIDQEDTQEFWYHNFSDADDTFNIEQSQGSLSNTLNVQAWSWEGATKTKISATASSTPAGNWEITLGEAIEGRSIEIAVHDGAPGSTKPIARAWMIDTGAVEWTRGGAEQKRILYQNTGIFTIKSDDQHVLHNHPRIREPENAGTDGMHLFVRVAKIDGTVSLGGRSTASVLISSDGNHARHSSSDVSRVQLYPPSAAKVAWKRFLTDDALGYTYAWDDNPGSGTSDVEPVAYIETGNPNWKRNGNNLGSLSTTLVETEATLTLRGGV